ncbi:protein ZGRF1 [Phodopus roborovskii]|uniref:protein ZGRF1 n=1 Tax=Phodopus roborovskii TaxID=109678 RepID=UPI0021E43C58|nr:protein ZGRF1 [Phodopus roborovskii]
MESQEFIVLYTHQKMKKSKVWQDGVLKVTHLGNKAILYDDKGACLESLFLKSLEVKPGDDLESERYLITVEEAKAAGSSAIKRDGSGEALDSGPRTLIHTSRRLPGCQPSGLKRKATGFQTPYKVPKQVTVTENGESAASSVDLKAGLSFPPPFSSTLPLFSTVGQKDINPTLADSENAVTFRSRERSDRPFSLVSSFFRVSAGTQSKEDKFSSPVTSETQHSDSLLASEPTRRNNLESHCPGVSQNIRSKAQILALLKSKSTNVSKDLTCEITGCSPKIQAQGCSKINSKPEEERRSSARLCSQLRAENPTRATSRWTVYLPSQRSPPCSPRDENDTEDKPEAKEDIDLAELSAEKKTKLFKTCDEKGEFYSEDNSVDSNCQSWNYEENLGAPSFCENSNLLVGGSSKENVHLLLEPDIEDNSKVLSNQNGKVCVERTLCTGESMQVAGADATVEQECTSCASGSQLPEIEGNQIECCLRKNYRVSDDIVDMGSKGKVDRESLDTVHDPSQPFLEVSFDLSNFETSDTDEASLEDNKLSQDSESGGKEVLLTDDLCVQKSCGDIGYLEIAREPLPLLTSASGRPKEILPANEALLSEFCDRTCVGFYAGCHEDADTGKAGQEQCGDTGSSLDSSQEWSEDVPVDSKEDGNKSIHRDGINNGIDSPTNKPKGMNTSLHIPYFLNTVTNPAPENSDLFSEGIQPQHFILRSHIDNDDEQVLPPVSNSGISIQLLNATQDHSECHELDESNTQVSSSLFYPVRTKHPVYKDTGAYIPESEDLGRIRSLPCDRFEVETTQRSKQPWAPSRNSSELPEVINNMPLLKSLSVPSTTLGSLPTLKKKHTFQQEAQHVRDPAVSPEARKSPATVLLHTLLEHPLEQWASQQPVEFQGHQVKGSATSGLMVRGYSVQLGCSQFPGSIEYEDFRTRTPVWTPELPSTCVHTDFLQVISPEQKISASSPAPTFSFDTRNEDSVLEFSEESLKARTFPGWKNRGFVERENLQRFPFANRASVPFIALPPDDSCSFMTDDDVRESSVLNLCEESVLSLDLGPEDQGETSSWEGSREKTPGDDLLLLKSSTQSKWLKYQNTFQCNSAALNRIDGEMTEGVFAEGVSGMQSSHTSERLHHAVTENSVDHVQLQMMKGMLYQQHQDFSSQGLLFRKSPLSLNSRQISKTEEIQATLGSSTSYNSRVKDLQEINSSELCFPSGQKIISAYFPQRQVHIPAFFQSPIHYKQIFTSSIIEHLNILLFGLAQRLYKALSKVDISFYMSSKGETLKNKKNNSLSCHHNQPAKLVMVKKEGPNKGRLFYTCDRPKGNQCKFFKWLEEATSGRVSQDESQPNMVFNDVKSIGSYLRSQKVPVYEECQLLLRKGFDLQRKQYGKLKKFATVNPEFYSETKSKIYLKLSRKESSSTYSKGDLWVISKTLDFELDTFIACSAFFGPSSVNEVELLPLKGYFPSKWPTNVTVHALLVCNASTELTTLQNIQDYFNPATLPIMPYLLAMSQPATVSNKNVNKRKFIPPTITNSKTKFELLNRGAILQLASELIDLHGLNKDQATALIQIAEMMASQENGENALEPHTQSLPITVIHGVFGAGKSYLLAVVILFFVQLFEKCDAETVGNVRPWKLLISSSTNVAVDRVLLGLLSLGFEKFIRVGSVRKIAKPILPYSLHAGSDNESEQLKELHALMKEELTPVERVYVRKSIEQHKLGTNRALLKQVRVVGITCAACPFSCMNDLKFPVVVLDECSQMTEPASLLPIARFESEKLILVGDPKQLPPTIQGSDAAHENGLEQTLFDRLCLMGHKPILLRTQYRCHPVISAIANDLFYEGNLVNGISETERSPVLEWLPTLCFYNVTGTEQVERENSFQNVAEAAFILKLIQSLIASGIAGSMIGVITLYKSQMYKICHLLSAVDVNYSDAKSVQVSTVDAFQGAEKEIIILSCVRTRQVGFIDSEKRMNVALTRGKRHLLIVGSLSCLRKNRLWERVIQHCEGREDGLQQASQCEPQLDHLLRDYLERQAEEKQKKKEKEKSKDNSH